MTAPAADSGEAAAPISEGTEPERDARPGGGDGDRNEERRGRGGGRAAAGRGAQVAYSDYIDAINARDGAALCDLIPAAAIDELQAPVERGTCAATLTASIGYRDPRGFPVWRRTHLSAIDRTEVSADLGSARITAAIVTEFADRDEPSVESDIAYLERAGGGWRLAKPSSALYRALGNAEPPPSVIAPPQG